jgi:hypothetical protein
VIAVNQANACPVATQIMYCHLLSPKFCGVKNKMCPNKRRIGYSYVRAVAQAASRRPLAAETGVCALINQRGICGEHSGSVIDFSPSYLLFSYKYYSIVTLSTCILPE